MQQINQLIQKVRQRIAPSWPLENSVAVNPYLGVCDISFEEAANVLWTRGGIQLFMPISFYQEQIAANEIRREDLSRALLQNNRKSSIEAFLDSLITTEQNAEKYKCVSDLANEKYLGTLVQIMVDHTSDWLSGKITHTELTFTSAQDLYDQWKADARVDLSPEILGFKGFRQAISKQPNSIEELLERLITRLNLDQQTGEAYLHSLLLKILGWSSFCSGLDWQNNLYGKTSNYLDVVLSILVTWELAMLQVYNDLEIEWKMYSEEANATIANQHISERIRQQAILQDAYDYSLQRKLKQKFQEQLTKENAPSNERPTAQMVFCIDVRSEVFRRNLESVNKKIDTYGFAGFFGFPVKYAPINHSKGKNQCPVLIPSGPTVSESTLHQDKLDRLKRKRHASSKLKTAWSSYRSGSVASFGFVSPLGIFYLPKLISDTFGWSRPVANPKRKEFGSILSRKTVLDVSAIPFQDKVLMAKSALKAIGIHDRLAKFVLITGHGSSSVNNPHAAGLDCGACSGNSGEINALTAQYILNDTDVRLALNNSDIQIPNDTVFLAGLHDTTTDTITLLDNSGLSEEEQEQLQEILVSIDKASVMSAQQRSLRFFGPTKNTKKFVQKRAIDWSQVRPEWGLAGCHSFIIAPRQRTKGMDLEGKSFLHSYNWKNDDGYTILESIMTAPMIVTSWINLQYYASTVDNKRLGAGNKTLHNVTGGVAVLEGSKGDIRIGLPFQSIHDGQNYQHLPHRLHVIIEAPKDAVLSILKKHPNVQELFDNNWIKLLLINNQGQLEECFTNENQTIVESKVKERMNNQLELV